MGLFSGKETITVSSTVYNMAGEEANRPNFMKSTIFGAVMNPNSSYLGESLVQAYLGGPGINQRSLFNYAVRSNYPGLPTYSISKALVVDPEDIRPFIDIPSTPAGQEVIIQDASLADGDYQVFAERYMDNNYPDEINTDWVAEYNKNDHTITIQRAGGGTVNFSAGSYDPNGRFIVCNYYCAIPEEEDDLELGTLVTGVYSGLPSDVGFTLTSSTNTGLEDYIQDQTRVVTKVYSNGDPDIVTTDYPHIETSFNTIKTVMEKEVYNGGNGSSPQRSKTKTFRNVWEYREVYSSTSTVVVVNDIGSGHIETVTTVITGDFLRTIYNYRMDTQDTGLFRIIGGNKVFIYKIGTGNSTLDDLNVDVGSAVTAEFFPIIPIRLDNVSITSGGYSTLYEKSETLYRRATKKQTFEDLVAQVEDNEDLDDVDYAYVQWAVNLNTDEVEALKYIYTFWKNLIPVHGLPSDYIETFIEARDEYEDYIANFNTWVEDQFDSGSSGYAIPMPFIASFGSPKTTTLKFKTDHALLQDFDNRISFCFIDENVFTGVGKTGAKKGDLWMTKGTPISWSIQTGVNFPGTGVSQMKVTENVMSVTNIFWQTETNQYKKIRVYGAVHENFIYGGKSVRISADQSLDDADESGFLIPLHYPSLKEAGLVSSTQLATANTYIVFNSYEIVKQKWYETFLGMLFLIIIIVVAAALIAPGFVGGVSGIFGTNAAVGAGLGLTGTASIVAGAVANAIAAVIISTALSTGATAIFGEKWGALIGSLLSFAISFGMAGGFSSLSTLFQPSNLLALSSSLANGYQGFVQGSIAELNANLFEIGEDYQKEMDRIEGLLSDLMGNDLAFNPLSLTDANKGNGSRTGNYLPESLDDFIQRTTLTGSDIVDMTISMINDFSDLSLTLPRT